MEPLGNLAQNARAKQLSSARSALIFVGILTLAANGFLYYNAEAEITKILDAEVAKAGPGAVVDQAKFAEVKGNAINSVRIIYGGAAALGVVFITLGALVFKAPVPMVVTGLVLYIAANAIFFVINPASLASGVIVKVIIIFLLFRSAMAAFAYQREAALEAAKPDGPEALEPFDRPPPASP